MRFRPMLNWLETRDNPSGPDLLDPTTPVVTPDAPPAQEAPDAAAIAAAAAAAAAGFVNPLIIWGG